MKKRQTWEQVKKIKEEFRQSGLWPTFRNEELVAKAWSIAEQLLKHEFISSVGVFGSTSRGENGRDIDLIIIDDGTVSDPAFRELENKSPLFGFSSGGAYTRICYGHYIRHIPGGFLCRFCDYLLEKPQAIDLVFLNRQIRSSQEYLDALILNGNDPFFFQNIGKDALLFDPVEKVFRKNETFPGFINDGAPSSEMLRRIQGESAKNRSPFGDLSNIVYDKISSNNLVKKPKIESVREHIAGMVRFDEIGGQVQAKSEVMSLSAALKNPEGYQRWGTKPPRGICLYGPPGTGKTLLAKALASETNVPFYVVDASQLVSMWYGESEKNIDRTFEAVRKTGGILFFDEADSLASSRGTPNAHEVTKRIVAALCRNMDGFQTLDKVVVFFATNRIGDMDPAVLRPGRTDRIIEVPLPDREGRREIFEIHMREAEKIAARKLFENLDIESPLDNTDNYSGADIAEILRRTLEVKVKEEYLGGSPEFVSTGDILKEISLYERIKKNQQTIGFSRG